MNSRRLNLGRRKEVKRFPSHGLILKCPIVVFLLPFALLQLVDITPFDLLFDESITVLVNFMS